MIKLYKRIVLISFGLIGVFLFVIFICYVVVVFNAKNRIYDEIEYIPHNKVGLLLATSPITPQGAHNYYFDNRIKATEDLFKAGKIDYIIASGGDYTRSEKNGCNEPQAIRDSLVIRGIPADRIILDYDGTRTIKSIAKGREIYGLDSVTLISQKYHNERAIYLADRYGLHAIGYNAEPSPIRRNRIKNTLRELLARPKMFLDFINKSAPLTHHLPGNYEEIKQTLFPYLTKSFNNEIAIREFIYTEFDTVNRLYAPIFFRYPQKINGYNVEGVFYSGADDSFGYQNDDSENVMASLYFSNDSITFSVYQPRFRPYYDSIPQSIRIFDCVELNYHEPMLGNKSRICLDSLSHLPFFFLDIDFDGEKELLLEYSCNGQKTISTYNAYEVPDLIQLDPFGKYIDNFNCLDAWTEFDYKNEVVISSLWSGYDGNEKWYFKYEGDKLVPFKKEVYTEWFNKLKESKQIK